MKKVMLKKIMMLGSMFFCSEYLDLLEDVPAHGRGSRTRQSFRFLLTPKVLWFSEYTGTTTIKTKNYSKLRRLFLPLSPCPQHNVICEKKDLDCIFYSLDQMSFLNLKFYFI